MKLLEAPMFEEVDGELESVHSGQVSPVYCDWVLSTCQDDNLDDEQSEEPLCSRGEDVRPSSWSPATSGAPGDISPRPDITSPVTNITMAT